MGKLFITDGAKCICKYGTAQGLLKVNSQRFVMINAFKQIATTQELENTFYAPAFGSCTYNSPYIKACNPSVVKWSTWYKGMRLSGNAYPLLPESKATCAVAGTECIEIVDEGQIDQSGSDDNNTAEHQCDLDPMGDPKGLNKEEPVLISANII